MTDRSFGKARREVELDVLLGGMAHHDAPTLRLGEWEIWQVAQRLSRRTIEERLRVIALFHHETQIQPISATTLDIARWYGEHADDWSDATAATYHSYLRAWHRWLIISDIRTDDPMTKLGTPKVPEREPRPISDADVIALLGTRMWGTTRAMILLALLAGLRVHEIAKVRGEDFDLSTNMLWVKGKGRKTKSIPLHRILAELTEKMPESGWWFPMRGYPSEHVHSKSVSDVVGRTMRRAGVRGTPHALRHWYASTLLDNGNDLRTVQELMRHKSVQSTQIYTQVTDERRREAIAGLDLIRPRKPVVA